MHADVLNKPKQGAAVGKDWAILMDCPEECNDEVEHRNTHPKLLGEVPQSSSNAQTHALIHRRSVLDMDEGQTTKSVLRAPERTLPLTEVAWREPLVVAAWGQAPLIPLRQMAGLRGRDEFMVITFHHESSNLAWLC